MGKAARLGPLWPGGPCAPRTRPQPPEVNLGGLGLVLAGKEQEGGLQPPTLGKAGCGEPALPANASRGQQRPAEPGVGGGSEVSVLWSSLPRGRGACPGTSRPPGRLACLF